MSNFNPFFNVVREPAFVTFNGQTTEIDKDVLLHEDTGDVLGIVSKNYELVQNIDVKNYFDEAFSSYDVTVLDDHGSNNNNKWIREIIFNDDKFVRSIVADDAVKLKVKVWNGFDGKTSVGYALEAYRLVCSNGMMGWGSMFSTRLPHMGEDVIALIKNSFENKFNNYQIVFDKMNEWTKIPYTRKSFDKFISDRTKDAGEKTSKFRYLTEKQADIITDLYPVVMNKYNEKENIWGAYNVLTEIGTHRTSTKATNSHLFTQGYKRMERLAEDFIKEAA